MLKINKENGKVVVFERENCNVMNLEINIEHKKHWNQDVKGTNERGILIHIP